MKKSRYNVCLRMSTDIRLQMLNDLRRLHDHAYERVGFLFTKTKKLRTNTVIVIATKYMPVDDADYLQDKSVGAKINSTAIRKAMQYCFSNKTGCFHVHLHDHIGKPGPSSTDKHGLPPIVDSFQNITNEEANGIIILSEDSHFIQLKISKEISFIFPQQISVIGLPMLSTFSKVIKRHVEETYSRQSFLGAHTQVLFENIKVGIVGYGGGGSHIGQQLAHLGVKNIKVFDYDKIERTNLNRLIGGWFSDIKNSHLKTIIAKRTINKILPTASVQEINTKWQENSDILQTCDIVFGCVDSYTEREQLEAECRRYLIPYIDIGMDVHNIDDGVPAMSGQVILSMPGRPCMRCMGFITERKLALEAAKYGDIGGRPQVVWPNGVLASTAVGIFVDLLSGWTHSENKLFYLSYNGNTGEVTEHIRLKFTDKHCLHYPIESAGPPAFTTL